jgi:hypothetical protein
VPLTAVLAERLAAVAVMLPVAAPAPVGANTTSNVHVALLARVAGLAGQRLVAAGIVNRVSDDETIIGAAPPVRFCTVKVCDAVLPTTTLVG